MCGKEKKVVISI